MMNIFIISCLGFMLGCLFGIKYDGVIIMLYTINFFFVLSIKCIIFKFKKSDNLCAAVLALLFAAGAFTGHMHDKNTFKEIAPRFGTDVIVEGTVSERDEHGFVVCCGRESYYVYISGEDEEISNDDTVRIEGSLMPYPTAQYPGAFDSRIYNALLGIYGRIEADSIEITGYDDSLRLSRLSARARAFIEGRIDRTMEGDAAGFVKAMLTGNTKHMSDEVKDNFRLTGIFHLVSVSGAHLSIFLSFFAFLTTIFKRKRIVGIILQILIVVMYTFLIGNRAAILRSAIMAILALCMLSARRRSDSVTNLTIAGLLLCFTNPYYMADAGFQMSFLATFGIVFFSKYFKNKIIAVPLIAALVMTPVIMYYCNIISLEAVLINVLTAALVPPVITLGYISCIIPAAAIPVRFISQVILYITDIFADIDFLHIRTLSPDIFLFVIWFLMAGIVYFLVKNIDIEGMLVSAVCIVVIIGYVGVSPDSTGRYTQVNFVNTGNYNVEHIITENKTNIFVDCGYGTCKYAYNRGISKIGAIWITENREAKFSDLENMCREFSVSQVLLPDNMKNSNLKLEKAEIIYYNQSSYSATADNVRFVSRMRNDKRIFTISAYNRDVDIPLGTKEVCNMGGFDILCLPDKCEDSASITQKQVANYYIHPTYRYGYYDSDDKYITAQVGLVTFKLYPGRDPIVY